MIHMEPTDQFAVERQRRDDDARASAMMADRMSALEGDLRRLLGRVLTLETMASRLAAKESTEMDDAWRALRDSPAMAKHGLGLPPQGVSLGEAISEVLRRFDRELDAVKAKAEKLRSALYSDDND